MLLEQKKSVGLTFVLFKHKKMIELFIFGFGIVLMLKDDSTNFVVVGFILIYPKHTHTPND